MHLKLVNHYTVQSSLGVWLELNGQLYANNSAIELREVYESPTDGHSLMCVTSKRPCCVTPYRVGQWIYPNESIISNDVSGNSFYRTRRDDGTVRLHRRGVASLAAAMGRYCCEVPSDNDINQRLCVHFGKSRNYNSIVTVTFMIIMFYMHMQLIILPYK